MRGVFLAGGSIFAEFLDAAIRDKAEAKPFPYTLEVCRCRYCSFCQNGKCALKRCCCISMTYRKSTDAATEAEVYFLASNPQGDITYIYNIDGNGTRVVTYVYDAWGRILSTTVTGANTIGVYNPFRYRGYYYDNETGFYYLNSRYYDPSSGRFLNADGQLNTGLLGYNLFAYCENNPVMYTGIVKICAVRNSPKSEIR